MGEGHASSGSVNWGMARRVLVAAFTGSCSFGLAAAMEVSGGGKVTSSALILAVLTGSVVFLAQQLVDLDRRQVASEKASTDLAQVIDDRFAQSNRASRLMGAVRASAVDDEVVTEMLDNTARLGVPVAPLVKAIAEGEIHRASRFLLQLVQGEAVYVDGEDQDWLLGLTRRCAVSLDATSTSAVDGLGASFDGGFWTSGLGQRYLKAQEDAVEQRGVRIRRLFIMRDYAEFTSAEFLPIVQLQRNAGIEVRALQHDQVPRPLRSSLIDFILFDDTIRYEVMPDPLAPGEFLKTHLHCEPLAVLERRQRFDRLWALAEQQERDRIEQEGGPEDVLEDGPEDAREDGDDPLS